MVYAAGGSGFGEAGVFFSLTELGASEPRDLFNVPELGLAADVWERVLFDTESIKSRGIFFSWQDRL